MNQISNVLLIAGAVALALAAIVPGRATERLPAIEVKRRIYWSGSALGAALLFAGGLPDVQSAVAFLAAATILMTGWAYFRTPYIKIGGRVYSAHPAHRETDPPTGR
ncbi:hypothetical protein [Mycobacterium sp. SMC-4]|uniref:hypothetical protein n=1 Tax=Mycobacterium sp. SMC-4 TaxID=2857059 RepID=UPI003D010DE8